MEAKKKITGHLLATFTTFVWGTTFISTKTLLNSFSAVEIIIFRLLIGMIVLFIAYPKVMKFQSWKKELRFFIAAVTGVSFYQVLENFALSYSFASTTGIIISTAPMFTAICVFIFLRERKPTITFFAGFITAMTGIILINFNGDFGFNIVGVLLALAAAAIWGVYSVLSKSMNDSTTIIQGTRRTFEYGVITLIPMYFIFHCRFGFERFAEPVNLLNMLYLGAVASATCFVTWNTATKRIGVIATSLYLYALPVVTVIFSAVILREAVTWKTVVGTILTLAGLIISEYKCRFKCMHHQQ